MEHFALDLNQRVKVSHKVIDIYVIWQWLSGIQDKSNLTIEPCIYCLPGRDRQRNPTRRRELCKLSHLFTRRLLTSQKLHVLIKNDAVQGQLFLDSMHNNTIVPHLMGKTGVLLSELGKWISCFTQYRLSQLSLRGDVTHTILPPQVVLLIYMYEVTEDLKMWLTDKWTNKSCRPKIMSLWGMWRTEIQQNPTLV